MSRSGRHPFCGLVAVICLLAATAVSAGFESMCSGSYAALRDVKSELAALRREYRQDRADLVDARQASIQTIRDGLRLRREAAREQVERRLAEARGDLEAFRRVEEEWKATRTILLELEHSRTTRTWDAYEDRLKALDARFRAQQLWLRLSGTFEVGARHMACYGRWVTDGYLVSRRITKRLAELDRFEIAGVTFRAIDFAATKYADAVNELMSGRNFSSGDASRFLLQGGGFGVPPSATPAPSEDRLEPVFTPEELERMGGPNRSPAYDAPTPNESRSQ